jgi:hypothetical protein
VGKPSGLSAAEKNILRGLVQGSTLKVHRDIDGNKQCKLHPLDGPVIDLGPAAVAGLKRRGLLDSNKKFPAATYLLTDRGRQLAELLAGEPVRPLSANNF